MKGSINARLHVGNSRALFAYTATEMHRRPTALICGVVFSSLTSGSCVSNTHCLGYMPRVPVKDFAALVTDAAGSPLPGVTVTVSQRVNPGPTDSFCCSDEPLGHAVTDRTGHAMLKGLPPACRELAVTAGAAGWRTISMVGEAGAMHFVLGRVGVAP